MSENGTHGRALLDRAAERLRGGHVEFGMESLRAGLSKLRSSMRGEAWERFVAAEVARHPVLSLIVQSPFTKRALKKPRGYAGDAVMLDYIFGATELPDDTSPLGRAVYRWEFETESCRSVRARRQILAEYLDAVAAERPNPRILSVACGHLREAELSKSVSGGDIGEFFALDQDPQSLAVVDGVHGERVRTVRESAGGLVRGRTKFSDLDFIYVSGLYD
jgi:extracellular factor (EF) 3-hydroxypalmitic acid methyl ester biosynthesis protein